MSLSSTPSRSARPPVVAPAVVGFAVLLAALFGLSYAIGSLAGPVAPGMHAPGGTGGSGTGGSGDGTGGMSGMGM
ncbi:hypothetical protein [Streptomyces sp. ICBB 8177]|uniref:hypothetical protein n=1 Tax=Streptomyces sp. ICBB 8177 TaxID=563922 RepID=UPI000D681C0A|nr:hypothetical protein [Streptomyces sp. ICBB 8177]PWI42664.1 hypothetical protein CK485_10125 [Streptomyces sp. ICBB 8177]